MNIHKTAIIDKKAQLAEDVQIGPNTIIGSNVKIGSGCWIGPNCVLEGWTTLGKNNKVFTGAVLGSPPQDLKFRDEKTEVIIGDNNTIREYITINPGTAQGESTRIGNNNLLMAYTHIAHNCLISNNVVIANAGTLAGHVVVEDNAIVGGLGAMHQFVRVGKYSIVGGCSKLIKDAPPFSMVDGHPARVYGLNVIGLRRAGFSAQTRALIKKAFKIIFRSGLRVSHAVDKVKQDLELTPEISYLCEFIEKSERGLSRSSK